MTRGIRNNNPLNIRYSVSNHWFGQIEPDKNGFCRFAFMEDGFLAAYRLIHTYMLRYHLYTIEQIITRWAPAKENNTVEYIRYVCHRTGIGGRENLTIHDSRLEKLVLAMACMECSPAILEYKEDNARAYQRYLLT